MAKQIQDINTGIKQSVGTNGSSSDWTNLVSELTKEYGTFSETKPSSSDGLGDTKSTYGICPSKKVWTNIDSVLSESDFVINGSYSDNQLVDKDNVVFSYKNPEIYLAQTDITTIPKGETFTRTPVLTHVPSNTYEVTCPVDWVTITKNGNVATIVISKTPGKNRSTTITFSCTGREGTTPASRKINVYQDGFSVGLSSTFARVSYKSQSFSTKVTSGYEWTLSGLPNWLTASALSGNPGEIVTFTTTKNTGTSQRQATITFTCGDMTATYNVTQLGYPSLTLDKYSGSVTPAAQTKTITVRASNNQYYTVTSDSTWATVPSGQQGRDTFDISVTKNSGAQRQATITVQGYDHDNIATDELKKTYTLTQESGITTISVNPTSLSFTPAAAYKTATVTYSNTSGYSVSSSQTWCTVSKSGNTVTVSATKNSGGQRTATVTITAAAGTYDGATPNCTIAVTQTSGVSSFSIAPDTISLTSNAATSKTFTVSETNISSWSVSSKPSWVTVDTANRTISITKNTGSDRSGTINFSATGTYDGATKTDSIAISQEGISVIAFDPTSLLFTPAAASKTLYVNKTNIKTVTVSSNQSWCTLTKSAGTDTKDTYTVAVTKNSGSARSCTITATGTGYSDSVVRTVTLTINQDSGITVFGVTPNTIDLASNAAVTKSFGYKATNANISSCVVSSKPDWVTVDMSNNNNTISIAKNTGSDRSGTITFKATGLYDGATKTDTIVVTQEGISILDLKPDAGLSFTPAAGTGTIYAEKTNLTSAVVNDNADWCTLTKSSGTNAKDTYTVSVTKNSGSARTCTITATGTGDSDSQSRTDSITISQSSGVSSFDAVWDSPQQMNSVNIVSVWATNISIIINSTNIGSWSVKSKPDWVTVNTTNKTVSLTKNTGANRSGTIVLRATGTYDDVIHECNLYINQNGVSALNIIPDAAISFGPSASNSAITVNKTNMSNVNVTSDATWCTVTKSSTSDSSDTYTVSVTKNSGSARSCTITATGTGDSDSQSRTDSITVSQSSGVSSMTVKNSSGTTLSSGHDVGGTYEAISSSFTVTTTNTGNWTATSDATWCTLNKTSGSSGGSFTISASKNTGAARSTTVTVTSTGSYDSKKHTFTFDVSQASGESVIVVTPASLSFKYAAQSNNVNVALTNATGYNVSSNQSWCTVSNNSNKITVSKYYSATEDDRSATVTFTATGTADGKAPTDTVSVTQSPSAYLSASKTTWSAPAKGGSTTTTISTFNCAGYEIRSGLPDWLSASKSGSTVTLTAAENEAASARSYTVYFDTVDGDNGSSDYHYCTVTQAAATITYELDVTPDTATSIKVGATTTLKATYYTVINGSRKYSKDVTSDSSTTWSSNKTANATVSKGTVTGRKGKDDGTTTNVSVTISATYSNKSDSTTVNVSDNIFYGVEVTCSDTSIKVGETTSCVATYFTNINGNRRASLDSVVTSDATWRSDKTANATVNKGVVTGVKGKDDGTTTNVTATISASYNGYGGGIAIHVSDDITYGVDVTPKNMTVAVGSTTGFTAKYYTKVNGTRRTSLDSTVTLSATWSSSDDSIATVTSLGVAKGIKGKDDGTTTNVTATISASYNGYTGSGTIYVYDVVDHGVEVTCSDTSIKVDETTSCVATYYTTINGTRRSSLDTVVTGSATWSSNKPANATVAGGTVTGKKGKDDGTTTNVSVTISATYSNKSDSITIKVSDNIAYGILISSNNNNNNTVSVGNTITLTATYYTKVNGTRRTSLDTDVTTSATWSSADESIATVNNSGTSKGIVTGRKGKDDGTTDNVGVTIYVSYSGITKSTIVRVYDVITYGLVIEGGNSVDAGSTLSLTAYYITKINGTRKTSLDSNVTGNITWTSSDTSRATVSKGVVTAKSAVYGAITITAKYGATYTATHSVQVNYQYSYLEITPSESSIQHGSPTAVTPRYYTVINGSSSYTLPSTSSVAWESSDTSIATISTYGVVSAKSGAYGTVTITGTYNGYSDTCTINVNYTEYVFTIEPATATIAIGSYIDLSCFYTTKTNGEIVETNVVNNSDVTWSGTNKYIEVSSGNVPGRVKGLKKSYSSSFSATGKYNNKTASCSIKVVDAEPAITVNPTSWSNVPAAGSSAQFSVTLVNAASYEVTCPTWVTASKGTVSGGRSTLTLTVSERTSTSGREGTVTLTCSNDGGSASATIHIVQLGASSKYIDVSPTSITIAADDMSWKYFDIEQSGTGFSNNTSYSVPSWLDWDSEEGQLMLRLYSANTGTSARTGYFYLKGNDGATNNSSGTVSRITITNSAPVINRYLNVTPETWNVPNGGGRQAFQVSTDNGNFNIDSYPNWVTIVTRTGSGVTFSVDTANGGTLARTGTIVLSHTVDTNIKKVISVTQAGIQVTTNSISVSPTSYKFPKEGGTTTFTVTTNNNNFTVSSKPSWVTTSKTITTLQATASKNPNPNARAGNIVLAHTLDSTKTARIRVTQVSSALVVQDNIVISPTSWSVPPNGGTQKFTVIVSWASGLSSDQFTVYQKPDWVSQTAIDGESVTFTVLGNGTNSQRTGQIVLKHPTATKYAYVNVTQDSMTGDRMTVTINHISQFTGPTTDGPSIPTGYLMYKSTSAGGSNTVAKMRINISGYAGPYNVKLLSGLVSGNVETKYDYGVIGGLDINIEAIVTSWPQGSSATKHSTFAAWTHNALECEYTFNIPDTNSHFIEVLYRKDSSGDSGSDCMYCQYQV